MDEQFTQNDERDQLEGSRSKSPISEDSPQLLRLWDRFWAYITKLGMGNIALRAGSALVTIGLVGLVIWVMKGFFIPSEKTDMSANLPEAAANIGPVELPSYAGIAPVEGLSPSANTINTAPAETAGSRYEFTTYEVKAGDSVYSIAESFSLKPASLLWTNYETLLDNPAFILPGQTLKIPPVDGVLWPWVKGNGLNKFSETLGVTPEDIINWPGNNLSMDTIGDFANPNITEGTKIFVPGGKREFVDQFLVLIQRDTPAESALWGEGKCAITDVGPLGTSTYVWPTSEMRVSGYEWTPDVGHYGIDIGGKTGNPIYTVDNGVVVYAGWSTWGYGNVVVVDHGNDLQTIYAHLDTISVTCNQSIYQGDTIGTMGSTGNSSGPHLHFEIRQGSVRLNPHNYIG
jgi:murein DD-endopeptidase MepM/ murein hydrolase activator NlpD